MNEKREQLLDRMIRLYGFENPITIDFARMCEAYPSYEQFDKCLECLVECHEASPYIDEEE